MSLKKNDDYLKKIFDELIEIKKVVTNFTSQISEIRENLNLTKVHVMDLSSKVDLNISTLNITSSNASKNNVVKASSVGRSDTNKKVKSLNIMSYFKLKYKLSQQDPDDITSQEEIDEAIKIIDSVLPKKEMDAIFEKYKDEIKNKSPKKDIITYKATLLSKECIKDKPAGKTLRIIKGQEESDNIVHNPEIVEKIISDDEDNNDPVEYADSDDD